MNRRGWRGWRCRWMAGFRGIGNWENRSHEVKTKKQRWSGGEMKRERMRTSAGRKDQKSESRELAKLVRERMKDSAAISFLGIDVEEVRAGHAVFYMNVEDRHRQIHNVVHGGFL